MSKLISEIKRSVKIALSAVYRHLQGFDSYLRWHGLLQSGRFSFGRHTYFSNWPRVDFFEGHASSVKIGCFVRFAKGVVIVTGGRHCLDAPSSYPFKRIWDVPKAEAESIPQGGEDVIIANDVWIGTEAMILSGVRIGNGAVVGARAVVTKDVPPYAVVAGVPAKVVRYRFSPEEIEKLERIAWWDWNDEEIRKAVPLLSGGSVSEFISEYYHET